MENIDTKNPNWDIINKDCRDMTDDDKLYLIMLFKQIDAEKAKLNRRICLLIFGLLVLWTIYSAVAYFS